MAKTENVSAEAAAVREHIAKLAEPRKVPADEVGAARERMGLKQHEAAALLYLHPRTWQKYEEGRGMDQDRFEYWLLLAENADVREARLALLRKLRQRKR